MRYDAIVIGAGMSGLAAGIRLAQSGKRVVVLEKHELWGGLNSFYTRGGRPFDVGLHALTNYARAGARGAVLTRLLRALRLSHGDLELEEQGFSEILLPGLRLTFTNDSAHFQAEVERAFPRERDGFARLLEAIRAHPLSEDEAPFQSGRARLKEHLRAPELVDALLLPLLFYGSAREDDLDWRELVVLFRSIFLEGLARPAGGIRTLLNLLVRRLKASGAELCLSTGVRALRVTGGAVRGVVLEDGEELASELVFSSAGRVETHALRGAAPAPAAEVGRLSFLESISILDRRPSTLGLGAAASFFCCEPPFRYRRPVDLLDVRAGVVSSPDNFGGPHAPGPGTVRLTVLANHDRWCALEPAEYALEKARGADEALQSAARLLPDWSAHTVFRDVFTPRTIRHYTGHAGGAVYGSPQKHWSGRTETEGLFLIGTDQGYLGVIGALVSGVTMANRHGLVGAGIP